MVKPLVFKGDKKIKKRKHRSRDDEAKRGKALAAGGIADALAADGTADGTTNGTTDGNAVAVTDDDAWVSAESPGDVAGPVMLVLPSASTGTRPAALACDANGSVFALPIENIVDGNAASAEPHDVRQVWVAHRVTGTELFRFKGHHGKFLGCDQYGLLSATAVAVSPVESFALATDPDDSDPGVFSVRTARGTFLAVAGAAKDAPLVRGDATETGLATGVRIRMQARFKPQVQSAKADKARETVSRRTLEDAVGRRLNDDEVRLLKRARRHGTYHEAVLDLKVKSKSDRHA